jgi:hypothetical protein
MNSIKKTALSNGSIHLYVHIRINVILTKNYVVALGVWASIYCAETATHKRALERTRAHTHMRSHTHAHKHTHKHTHTHTHTRARARAAHTLQTFGYFQFFPISILMLRPNRSRNVWNISLYRTHARMHEPRTPTPTPTPTHTTHDWLIPF